MNDSLLAAAKRVNASYNASYIFAYQGSGGSQLLYGDPAHDITNEVLDELNKAFKKKRK
jgi:Skp family chaperone for outer membrane proteins